VTARAHPHHTDRGATVTTPAPLTPQQLDEIETRYDEPHHPVACGKTCWHLAHVDVPALVAEVRRLGDALATVREQAIHWAAETTDAKLAVEPDHNRASALYELLLHLRGQLPCTCARTGGLHAKDCRKYVPGHELISRRNALAAYRRERPAEETHVVADDSDDPEHIDDCPGCTPATPAP
jgi:hypothetical protein